jgi:hypothetical protein
MSSPGESCRQEHSEALQDCQQAESKMDVEPFYVNTGLNTFHYTKALIDSGCFCFASISQYLCNKLRLPPISIAPRQLEGFTSATVGQITEVTYADIDIDGYKRRKVFFYVIPHQTDDIILGKPLVESDLV